MKILRNFLVIALLAAACFSGWQVWRVQQNYRDEAAMHEQVLEFRPIETEEIVNQSVVDLRAQFPDVAGWLTVPNTRIDYPFVWYPDNDFYLRRDLHGNHAAAGTLFMDFRSKPDFTARNTILYGHNMRNGSMFGTLQAFQQAHFFNANPSATIFLPYDTLTLDIFAYLIVRATDAVIYSVDLSENYLDYVRQHARHFRDIDLTDDDRIVTLSTCGYDFQDARLVLLGRVRRE